MLRYALGSRREVQEAEATFEEELRFTDAYLALEKLRLGDRLRVERSIEPDTLSLELPSLTVRALIVEDEPLAIDRLRACLAYAGDVELIGEARDGQVAQDLINRLQPDLVFLDIQLPLMSGFEVLRSIRHRPGVIFTTAHNEYAVSAFEWGAFDYLLKPFDRERIALALKRYQQRSGLKDSRETMAERLDTTESQGQLRRFL